MSSHASPTPDSGSHATTQKTSAKPRKPMYSEEKARNIAKNKALLGELGLLGGFRELLGVEGNKKVPKNRKKKGPVRYSCPNTLHKWLSHLLFSPSEVPPSPSSSTPARSQSRDEDERCVSSSQLQVTPLIDATASRQSPLTLSRTYLTCQPSPTPRPPRANQSLRLPPALASSKKVNRVRILRHLERTTRTNPVCFITCLSATDN